MPRTTTLESSGCPPLRALTFDALGLVKVIEARSKEGGVPKVVERWGDPDAFRCVLAASFDDSKTDPLLAVARKNSEIEILNPLNGETCVAVSSVSPEDDAIVGLHLLKRDRQFMTPRSCTVLTCTTKGSVSIRSFEMINSQPDFSSLKTWNICGAGSIFCSQVHNNENYALFGGKGIEMNIWDIENCTKTWTAKPPLKDNLGIFTPTWFTSAAFLSKDDHRKFVAGTNSHQVRLYDMSTQRRPVISFDFRETPIKAVAEDTDGHRIYIGNGSGDLASVDIRTGKLLGCFLGKCAGSIRSIARHSELPIIASCGLDRYVRFWDVNTRQLLSAVFLKQHLNKVIFDTNFTEDNFRSGGDSLQHEAQSNTVVQTIDEKEILPEKRKKSSKEKGAEKRSKNDEERRKSKSKKRSKNDKGKVASDA